MTTNNVSRNIDDIMEYPTVRPIILNIGELTLTSFANAYKELSAVDILPKERILILSRVFGKSQQSMYRYLSKARNRNLLGCSYRGNSYDMLARMRANAKHKYKHVDEPVMDITTTKSEFKKISIFARVTRAVCSLFKMTK